MYILGRVLNMIHRKTFLRDKELWPERLPNSFTNRVRETIDYLGHEGLSGAIADCGENNPMKLAIETYFNVKIDSIDFDFDYPFESGRKYDVILCLEVLVHLFNPLLFLEQLKEMLNENGIIYLSTPRQFPQFLKAIHHYHEIPTDRLMWLFNAAGFRVMDKKKITIAGNWYNHIIGIRPILRYFQRTRIYKLII